MPLDEVEKASGHRFKACKDQCQKPGRCQWCDGGLAYCTVCTLAEAELGAVCGGQPERVTNALWSLVRR